MNVIQSPNFSLRKSSKKNLIPLRWKVYHSSLTSASTARFDFVVTMFAVGKTDEDTVNCPRFVAYGGDSREDSSSTFNLGQLKKWTHGNTDEFDEEEAQQPQRQDRRRRAPFYLESPIGFTFTWNRPLCAVLMLFGGGGGQQNVRSLTCLLVPGRGTGIIWFFCVQCIHSWIFHLLSWWMCPLTMSWIRKTTRSERW